MQSNMMKNAMNLSAISRTTLWSSAWVCLVILGLFYYWFALADRYAVFLYGHLGGTPFDETTISRYWMAGLVAAAILLVQYLLVNGLVRLVTRGKHPAGLSWWPPSWWQVWGICALPLGIGIFWIVTQVNSPTLPASLAFACVLATWIGLALALCAGEMAARRLRYSLWLGCIGFGLVPILLLVRAVELPARGIINYNLAYGWLVAVIVFGLIWTTFWLWFYRRRHETIPPWYQVAFASLVCAYLGMPLLHYWVFTPPAYRYISAASNFFPETPSIQVLTFAIALVVLAVAYLPARRRHSLHVSRA